MNDLRGLKADGFTESTYKFEKSTFRNEEKIKRIREVIKLYFHKTKTINSDNSSYGLKHIVEKHLDFHVSNGELIYSMHLEDFIIDRKNIHCNFNIGKDGIRLLKKSNDLIDTLRKPYFYDHGMGKRSFLKYKYIFNSLIDCRFKGDIKSKKNAYTIIGLKLGEDIDVIYTWLNIFNSDDMEIPEDKLKQLIELFSLKENEIMTPKVEE